jgi:hypothetical protein
LANNFPARALGFEDLRQETKEGAADCIDPLAAVGPLVSLGQKSGRQQRVKQQVQLEKALLADLLPASAEVGEAAPPGRKEWRMDHDKYIYLSQA